MMAQQNNDIIGDFLSALFKGIGKGIKNAFYGLKKIHRPLPLIGFAASLIVSFLAYKNQLKILSVETLFSLNVPVFIRYLFYWLLLMTPFFGLSIVGKIYRYMAEKYNVIFADIGFIGKDKKYPYLISKKKDGKKVIYLFKSNIPLIEWKKAKERLETGLDCSIRLVKEGNNKKLVQLVTVSSDFKIPEMLKWSDTYISSSDGVLCIGQSDLNQVSFDLNRTPHVLAAGETGSGKSVILRAMLWQMINKGSRLYMIDFKGGVEFGKAYEQFGEVITQRERALSVLQLLVKENEERLKLFRELEVKNLKEYNVKTHSNLCRIGVFIDELAEMLDKKGVAKDDKVIYEQLEGALSTLARLSRATGINLFLGVQRPDANVLTGQIKNNIPVRISGRFADKTASEIVLGNTAACELPDIKGRFLYKVGNDVIEFQSYYFDDEKDLHQIDIEPGEMLTTTKSKKQEQKHTDVQLNKRKMPERPEKSAPQTKKEEKKEEIELDFDFDD